MNRRPIMRNILVGGAISIFIIAIMFVTFSLAQKNIQFRLLAWDASSPEKVDINFEVRKPADLAVTCVLRAQDKNRIDVGYAEVDVPSGSDYNQLTYQLRTLAPAYTAEVLTCVSRGDPPESLVHNFRRALHRLFSRGQNEVSVI